jgi:hypothetical protein
VWRRIDPKLGVSEKRECWETSPGTEKANESHAGGGRRTYRRLKLPSWYRVYRDSTGCRTQQFWPAICTRSDRRQ